MSQTNPEIISYQKLRTFIGLIGICLPIALIIGCYVFHEGSYSWQHSISHYYYSKMHILFVCTLSVLGGFLITYKGKPKNVWESRLSNFAGYCAFGVAALPTTFEEFRSPSGAAPYVSISPKVTPMWGNLHFVCAGLLFLSFVIFCLYFFQKPDEVPTLNEDIKKLNRRKTIYKICGWGILISVVALFIFSKFLPNRSGVLAYSTFIFETTSLWCFGIAWLIKGSATLKNIPVLKFLIKPLR